MELMAVVAHRKRLAQIAGQRRETGEVSQPFAVGQFAEADPIRDVAGVLAFLAYAPTWYPIPQDRAWAAARAFAEEYFAHVPGAWRTGLPPHYAGAVLRMAVGIYRSQGPGWPDEVEALVEEAKDSVEGRVW